MSWHRVSFISASWMCRGEEPPASFKVESGLCKTPSFLVTLISLEPGSRKTTNVTASSKESHFPAIPVFASSQKHATKLDHGLFIVSCYVDHCWREKWSFFPRRVCESKLGYLLFLYLFPQRGRRNKMEEDILQAYRCSINYTSRKKVFQNILQLLFAMLCTSYKPLPPISWRPSPPGSLLHHPRNHAVLHFGDLANAPKQSNRTS